jgi:hypothetical protein
MRVGRRANVALLFAICLLPVAASVTAGLDMSRLADGRAVLQQAVDNAALSGASAYSENGAYYQSLGYSVAVSSFCDTASSVPEGFTLISSGSSNGMTAAPCSGMTVGPSVVALTSAYTVGTAYTPTGTPDSRCTSLVQGNTTYTCGFIVTVTATATMNTSLPALFGASKTVTVTASAANPFINFAKVFAGTSIASGAKYANSVWVYPLLLNPAGHADFSTNPGALPDNTTCLAGNGPDATTCGSGSPQVGSAYSGFISATTLSSNYVMLANTEYTNSQIGSGPFTSPISGITYVGGAVQNPPTPPGVTATTPLGVAFQTIAGGNLFYNSSTELTNPGVYGYDVVSPGGNPQYITAQNGCAFPYDNLAYQTVTQDWQTSAQGVISPLLPWGQVTHIFYSSYLANPTPQTPSYLEINGQTGYYPVASQSANNEVLSSIPQDKGQSGANISGNSTYDNYTASINSVQTTGVAYQQDPPAATTTTPVQMTVSQCPSTTLVGANTYTNSISQSSLYPTNSTNNCSVFIVQSSTAGTPTNVPQYDGACFTPGGTPGQQYAANSCQEDGPYYYTFFWNDMGGAQYDNLNYEADTSSYTSTYTTSDGITHNIFENPTGSGDGTVQLHCSSSSHLVLIN